MYRLAFVTVLLAAAPAFAETKSSKLFDEGRALAGKGKWDAACEKFEQSLALDKAPGTELNYGDCLEHLGQFRKAWQMYTAAAKDFGRDKERVAYAKKRATAVQEKLVRIVVHIADPDLDGLVVMIGSTSVAPKARIEEMMEPGDVAITAKAKGHKPFAATASGDADATVTVEIPEDLGDSGDEPVVGKGPPDEPENRRDNPTKVGARDPGRVKIAWITGGVGLVAFAVAGGFAISASKTYSSAFDAGLCVKKMGTPTCADDADGREGQNRIDSAGTRADIATGMVVGGVVLVGAAAVIYFTAPRKTDAEISLLPSASPSGIGLAFSGRF